MAGTVVVPILDPSDKFRPEKQEELFRDYTDNCVYYNRVQRLYNEMHTKQTYDYAKAKLTEWSKFDHAEMTLLDGVMALSTLFDESDPDIDLPNSLHAFQTAERIRQVHPDQDWFHLTGFIHDAGKLMATYGEPQFSTVGDTFALGCAFAEECVFGRDSFKDNDDFNNPKYSSKLGIYEENCGLDKVLMSWGHDEYLYRVLRNHKGCTLPEEAFYIIRFHSFYPWHTGGAYTYLCDETDKKMMPWVLEFNKFDLYSKSDAVPDCEALLPYYQGLVDKYCPGLIKW